MPAKLGLWSGVGLVVANMVGAGVFLSAGFMAQDLSAAQILAAWVVGGVIAFSGAIAYSALAELVPRSGGEYRYLSELLHPFLGYIAGWASLLVGFAGPIAIDAYAAGAFLQRIWPVVNPHWAGTLVIVGLVGFHGMHMSVSRSAQNAMVVLKIGLVLCFIGMGLALGNTALPAMEPTRAANGFPWGPFATSLFFIAYAFSGWNAVVYAAEEFAKPQRDVARAMLLGCSGVAVAYLLVNWVLLTNVAPEAAKVVFAYESQRITLAHVVAAKLAGPAAGRVVSMAFVLVLISAASAMTFVGPRVYQAMARDGFLPKALVGKAGNPPRGSVILQGALALLILWTHRLQEILQNVGAILIGVSGLTALCLFNVYYRRTDLNKPKKRSLLAAGVFAAASAWTLYTGLQHAQGFWIWGTAFVVLAALAYFAARRRQGMHVAD